jgi:acetolactate synthase-1/2/3 large subunit
MTLMGLGALPATHPLCLGMLGMHAAPCTNILLEECDLLVAVGVRFDDRATGKLDQFCPRARVVHIDIDPGEMDKLRTPEVGITADAAQALDALLPLVERATAPPGPGAWPGCAQATASSRRAPTTPPAPTASSRHVARLLGEDGVVCTDVGQHQMRTAQAYPFARPGRLLTSGGLGTMGFGVPAAIGAALARPDLPVACFSGDGSILMNIQELATAVEQGANVKIVLLDNNALGLVQQQQQLFYGGRIFGSDYRMRPDFTAIARGFGMRAFDLSTGVAPAQTLAMAFAERGPCLIRVPVPAAEGVYPMVPPGAANREMIGDAAHVRP